MNTEKYNIQDTVGNIYWKDCKGNYFGCNKEYASVLGLLSPEEIIGKNDNYFFSNTLSEADLNLILQNDKAVMQTGQEIIGEEKGCNASGEIVFYLSKKVPLKDKNGEIVGLMGTSINITKEKHVQLMKAQFLEDLRCEINNPLNVIIGFSQIFSRREDHPEKKQYIKDLEIYAWRLHEYLRQMEEVSTLGNAGVTPVEFDLQRVIKELIDIVKCEINTNKFSLTYDVPSFLLYGDPKRIRRILLTVISTAIRYIEKGSIHLYTTEKPCVTIEIADKGNGEDFQLLSTLFEGFANDKEFGKFKLNGEILSIAKEFAKQLGATISVKKKGDQGLTFTLSW